SSASERGLFSWPTPVPRVPIISTRLKRRLSREVPRLADSGEQPAKSQPPRAKDQALKKDRPNRFTRIVAVSEAGPGRAEQAFPRRMAHLVNARAAVTNLLHSRRTPHYEKPYLALRCADSIAASGTGGAGAGALQRNHVSPGGTPGF